MSDTTQEHRQHAQGRSAACAVLTVSDTRTKANDGGGQIIVDQLRDGGHRLVDYQIVRDEPVQIRAQLETWFAQSDLDVICTTGGTGIARRDTTVEVVRQLLDKELEGFGELFRMLSWEQVGPAAMLSRAVAGLHGDTLIFVMPGSTHAVELAMSRLILPELPHLVWERSR